MNKNITIVHKKDKYITKFILNKYELVWLIH